MKIEIGESLCYSYLRHVKRCWLVQSNWKVSGAMGQAKLRRRVGGPFQFDAGSV